MLEESNGGIKPAFKVWRAGRGGGGWIPGNTAIIAALKPLKLCTVPAYTYYVWQAAPWDVVPAYMINRLRQHAQILQKHTVLTAIITTNLLFLIPPHCLKFAQGRCINKT